MISVSIVGLFIGFLGAPEFEPKAFKKTNPMADFLWLRCRVDGRDTVQLRESLFHRGSNCRDCPRRNR